MSKRHLRCEDWGACQNYGPFLGTLNIRCRIGPKKVVMMIITLIATGVMMVITNVILVIPSSLV